MSDVDDKKIEEVLTRLLEGPVGDRLCAKIVSQVGMDLSKVMEPYLTKKEYTDGIQKAEEGFVGAAQEAIEGLNPMLNELASYSARIHNLELMKATENLGLPLKMDMALMDRIRKRVLSDLETWTKNEEFDPRARMAMQEYLDLLHPPKDGSEN
jgi:hypothetical protein